jgi:hypothetical protein
MLPDPHTVGWQLIYTVMIEFGMIDKCQFRILYTKVIN